LSQVFHDAAVLRIPDPPLHFHRVVELAVEGVEGVEVVDDVSQCANRPEFLDQLRQEEVEAQEGQALRGIAERAQLLLGIGAQEPLDQRLQLRRFARREPHKEPHESREVEPRLLPNVEAQLELRPVTLEPETIERHVAPPVAGIDEVAPLDAPLAEEDVLLLALVLPGHEHLDDRVGRATKGERRGGDPHAQTHDAVVALLAACRYGWDADTFRKYPKVVGSLLLAHRLFLVRREG
jgi:hypothetical protein